MAKIEIQKLILQINDLTEETLLCDDIATFSELMVQHENIVSHFYRFMPLARFVFSVGERLGECLSGGAKGR